MGYNHIYQQGHQAGYVVAEAKYTKIINDNTTAVNKKIDNIETLAGNLVAINTASNDKMTEDIASILSKVKGKPLVIVKNGDCVPNQTFSDSFIQINKRANQAMKEITK